MKYAVLSLLILWSVPGFSLSGGFDRGNGGDAIICLTPDKQETVEVLDLFEQRTVYGKTLWTTINLSDSEEQILEKVIYRIENRYGNYGIALRRLYMEFWSKVQFGHWAALRDIDDEGRLVIPENCQLKQLAVQFTGPSSRSMSEFYMLNSQLWFKLSVIQRSGLILHELIYRTYLMKHPEMEFPNSQEIRKAVSVFMSDEYDYQTEPGDISETIRTY